MTSFEAEKKALAELKFSYENSAFESGPRYREMIAKQEKKIREYGWTNPSEGGKFMGKVRPDRDLTVYEQTQLVDPDITWLEGPFHFEGDPLRAQGLVFDHEGVTTTQSRAMYTQGGEQLVIFENGVFLILIDQIPLYAGISS